MMKKQFSKGGAKLNGMTITCEAQSYSAKYGDGCHADLYFGKPVNIKNAKITIKSGAEKMNGLYVYKGNNDNPQRISSSQVSTYTLTDQNNVYGLFISVVYNFRRTYINVTLNDVEFV